MAAMVVNSLLTAHDKGEHSISQSTPAMIVGGVKATVPLELKSARHNELVHAVREGGPFDVVFVGDSIMQTLNDNDYGQKFTALQKTWDAYLEPRLTLNLSHDSHRIEHLLWNLENGELEFPVSPKVFVLLVGTNNCDDRWHRRSYATFAPVHNPQEVCDGTHALIRTIRRRHPMSRVLLLRIFPRGGDEDVAVSLPAFHSSLGCVELCRRAGQLTRRLADNRYVFWLDVNGVFLRPDGRVDTSMLWDLLHPSPAGADAWVRAILPTLDRLIDEAEVEREIASSFPWLERFVRATCEWCHCLLCSKIGCARQRH